MRAIWLDMYLNVPVCRYCTFLRSSVLQRVTDKHFCFVQKNCWMRIPHIGMWHSWWHAYYTLLVMRYEYLHEMFLCSHSNNTASSIKLDLSWSLKPFQQQQLEASLLLPSVYNLRQLLFSMAYSLGDSTAESTSVSSSSTSQQQQNHQEGGEEEEWIFPLLLSCVSFIVMAGSSTCVLCPFCLLFVLMPNKLKEPWLFSWVWPLRSWLPPQWLAVVQNAWNTPWCCKKIAAIGGTIVSWGGNFRMLVAVQCFSGIARTKIRICEE